MSRLPARNLRARLTIFYSALLAGGLLLYAACVSAFYLHSLREQMDTSLDRDVETIEGDLYLTSDGHVGLTSHEGEADEDDTDRGYFLEVLGLDGSPLYRSDPLDDQALGPAIKEVSQRDSNEAVSVRLSSGILARIVTRHHYLPGGKPVVVRLGINEEPYRREFWEMVSILGFGLPIVVVLVSAAGYLLAARALRPVDIMAKRAGEITADRLNERIAIQNPDDELGQLGTAFNATLARLESSFDQLRRFTADASHELRTPLTAIRSVGEVAISKGGDERYYRDIIGSMLEEANRLTKLVDSLLNMSRADAGRVQLHFAEIGLLDLARESASLLEVLAEEKEQTLLVQGDETVSVIADRAILRQALVNLIDNAVKYSPVKGEIRVRVTESGRDAQIEVEDDGPGIPSEHRGRIFERFYRVDKARTRAEGGSGLGLAIAEWAVLVNRGRIDVQSAPDHGALFRISLPRTMTAADGRQ